MSTKAHAAPAIAEAAPVQIQFRASAELVERIDDHVDRMRARARGVAISRSDAVRSLLEGAIAREEEAEHEECRLSNAKAVGA